MVKAHFNDLWINFSWPIFFILFDIGHFIEEVYLFLSLAGFILSVLFFILLNAFEFIPIKPDSKPQRYSGTRLFDSTTKAAK